MLHKLPRPIPPVRLPLWSNHSELPFHLREPLAATIRPPVRLPAKRDVAMASRSALSKPASHDALTAAVHTTPCHSRRENRLTDVEYDSCPENHRAADLPSSRHTK